MTAEAIISPPVAMVAPAPAVAPLPAKKNGPQRKKLLAWFLGIMVAGGVGWIGYKQVRKMIAQSPGAPFDGGRQQRRFCQAYRDGL